MSRAAVLFTILASLLTTVIATTIVINVGEDNKNQFVPNAVNATKGDVIAFHFVGGHHDVVQSDSFGSCNQITNGCPNPEWYNYTVDLPKGQIWFFCSTLTHCKYYNMTGTIFVLDSLNQTNNAATPLVYTGFNILISSIVAAFLMI
ncbi:16948_t:CDS:2 [Cetraspora pellucida]|uniref:16948_t:CDS:1 n=1 Tax=Cetraspora pellucida TaxID=1433469 RepID=A0A9N9DDB4_9GLOM|nr:16948_t:CDS:2 [Cetraspora pellucida]